MKSIFTLLLCVMVSGFSVFAQNPGVVRGIVIDEDDTPLPFATVVLLDEGSEELVKAGYTNDDGEFILTPVPAGTYKVKVTYTSRADFLTPVFSLAQGEDKRLETVRLGGNAELEEVKIRAKKPLVTVKPDMTVFNVEASTNAIGSDALELLRKAPGVVVDNNDNIILQGKNGVRIYIDGKPSPLTAADLAAMLRTMQSSQIEAIEIITNPGAKYDAEGNAGIINIRLKKAENIGGNGNVDLGYAIQRYPKYNGAISGNYRGKKANVFGNIGGNWGPRYSFINFYRIQNQTIFDQRGEFLRIGSNINGKVGADFFLNDKHTIGFMANGLFGYADNSSESRTNISDELTGVTQAILLASSETDERRENANFNANYQYDNKEGTTWNIDADYGYFDIRSDAFQPNFYYDSPDLDNVIAQSIFTTVAPTAIDIYSFKVDHERNLGKGKLGLGVKSSYVNTDNDFQFFDRFDDVDTLNLDRSNRFGYRENINAGYVSYQTTIDKFGLQAGLRGEHTNSRGELTSVQQTGNDTVVRNYFNLFPSAGVTYQVNRNHSLRLNYSRRIDRPRYQNLNPFVQRIDELSYSQGNPFLRPQYTNSIELNHTMFYVFNTSLKYSRTIDLMTQITDTIEGTRSFITTENLASQDVVSLYFSAPYSPVKWWNTFTNAGVYYTSNRADYGPGKEIDLARFTFNIYHQSSFNLPKDFSFEVSGFYNSPSIWGANFKNQRFWGMDVGMRKKILDGKGNLKVAVSDIFYTMQWRGIQEFGGLYFDASGGWESRLFKVNFSYMFGKDTVKSARKRKTGLEDEKGRAGGGGGGGPGR